MAIKVMVVDDSAVVRGLVTRTLQEDPDIQVVASASNGRMALMELDRKPELDIVILDIEMPVMDGLTALPQLIARKPGLKIIMASTLTLRNADISLQALSAGAADYITKPSTTEGPQAASLFREALREKVKIHARASAARKAQQAPAGTSDGPAARASLSKPRGLVSLRNPGILPPAALAIASSTGGPQALFRLMADLRENLRHLPVFITQHMPPTFTQMLASHIERIEPLKCAEGVDGEQVQRGRIYVAPGGYHMRVARSQEGREIRLTQDPPVNFCRPSADPMIESLIDAFEGRLIIVVLTGMGSDGLAACRKAVAAGSTVVAQDEASSVVWGMPGAVAMDGLCSAVLPLGDIGPYLRNRLSSSAR